MMLKLVKENTMERNNDNGQQQEIHHQHGHYNIPNQQQQWVIFLISIILLQYADFCICHHIPSSKRISLNTETNRNDAHQRNRPHLIANRSTTISNIERSLSDRNVKEFEARDTEVKKRRIASGQPEEIFSLDDRIEANYDEYPMVVPKRAALLLDRLMVALHHALEQERSKLSDFYAERNEKFIKAKEDNALNSDPDQTNMNHMYSDDDPSVMMDYDFKDLNSINRATGQTRRGDISLDFGSNNDENVAMLTAAAMTDEDFGGLGGGGGSVGVGLNSIGNSGRMYWRCYFNAVSCF
ncbi:uncharacterized protein AstCC isoform X2 [Eurosta solidaginis]|uniref:uncharacterized protein AstCC isoform X2 n=1 Tax=Eurosta solidaginis TaxID=178769 RepID=UPI003530B602